VILAPDANSSVPSTAGEVVAEWTPFNLPNWTFMAFVDDEACPSLEGPETDCLIRGRGDEEPRLCRSNRSVSIFGAFDGG
jgi:hypothetical protein